MGKLVAVAAVLVTACSAQENNAHAILGDPDASAAVHRDSIQAITDRLAYSISRKDAVGAADRVPRDTSVVYVSDGVPIRGLQYQQVLDQFYSTVDSIDFRWIDREILFPTPRSAVVTGWASIRTRAEDETWRDDRAIFTLVYRLDDSGLWHYVTSQKTSMP